MRANENVVFNQNSAWKVGEGFYLAIIPYDHPSLDLDERGDLAVLAYLAAIEVDEVADNGALSDLDVLDDLKGILV